MKQSNFHSVKLKIKRTALLVVGLTLFQILAWAGPRSFQQAQAIAERQAALQGIVMDQQQVSKARKQYLLNGSSSIIRKTKCFRIWERNAIISKTKRNFSRLYPTPQNFKKIDRLRRNEIHLKAVRTPS